MTIYRCIGKGTTDSKGIAHITHDCNGNSLGSNNTGYTGTGAGLVNVIASTDPPSQISNDSNQSGRCNVFDCIHYVPCTSDTSNWSKFPNVDATYSDEGVHFTANASGSQAVNFVGNSTYFDASNSYVFEFDFKTANTVQMTFLTDGGTRRHIFSDYSGGRYNTWFHVKLIYNSVTQKVTPVIDGVAKTDVDLSSYGITVLGFSLADWQGDINCWIKDFKIYSPLFDHAVSSITVTGTNVIQTGETSILTITPQGANGHPVRNALIDLYEDDTKIATLDTGFNGEAIYTYTGTGSGQHSFKAKYRTIQSETYSIIDSILLDTCSSDTTSNYYYKDTGGTSLAFSNGSFVLTAGTSDRYTNMGTSNGITNNLSRFKSKKLRFEVDAVSITGKARVSILEYGNGKFTQQVNSTYTSDTGTLSIDLPNAVSDNCTRLYLRVQVENTNDSVTFKNFRVYPI